MDIERLLGNEGELISGFDREALLAWLKARLLELLLHQPERLAQICYQVDLDEAVFRHSLTLPPESGAALLAEAFLRREMARREWKKRYSG